MKCTFLFASFLFWWSQRENVINLRIPVYCLNVGDDNIVEDQRGSSTVEFVFILSLRGRSHSTFGLPSPALSTLSTSGKSTTSGTLFRSIKKERISSLSDFSSSSVHLPFNAIWDNNSRLMSGFTPSYADITITALSDFAFSVVFCSLSVWSFAEGQVAVWVCAVRMSLSSGVQVAALLPLSDG